MKTTSNNNNIESKNGMSQVINILTGETKKIRCHYLSKRTDKPVSRVLTLERLNHPALTAAGVTAWAERFNDGVNSFGWLRVSIQLTDKICYTPNCANVGLPDVENYGNLDYYMGQEGTMRVSMNNVDKFFQSIADKPAKMMTGEDWPNMAVIAAYRAAGRDEEADTLTTARDIYNARREAKNEAWRKKYAAQQYYYNSPKPKNFDELTELERAQFMMQTTQECAKDHPELDWADILENAEKRLEKAKAERQERYNARCKELEAEALAKMPYKVGDTVKSRDGVTGRVVEMYPEVTGDIDSPHLIYEYNGKPTVNVVILDADGKRHCAHWSFFTLQEASEITEFFTEGKKYRCIKSVIGNKTGRETFTKGKVYEQYTEPSVFYGWLRNNQGERHAWPQLDEMADYLKTWPEAKPEDIDPRLYFEPVEEITEAEDIREAEGIKVGDKVRHNKHEEVATVTAIREAFVNGCNGYRYLYTLDFGQSVTGPFDVELNGGEFLREAFTPCAIEPMGD